jgi:peptide/nickel transport system substrate-binding protein
VKKIFILLFSVLLTAFLLLTACTSTKTTTSTATQTTTLTISNTSTTTATSVTTTSTSVQDGGIFRRIHNEFPTGSIGIPWKVAGISDIWLNNIVECLYVIGNDGKFNGILAQSYEWTNNGATLVLHLRHGVKFHDGTPFNAEAVKWNIEQGIAAKVGSYKIITSVEAPNEYTVEISTAAYDASLYPTIASNPADGVFGYMISPTAYNTNGEEWANTHPIGTGPFKFKEYKADSYLLAERNDDYWGGKPHVAGIKSILIPDPVTAQMAFEAGEGESISFLGLAYRLLHDLLPKGYQSDTWPELKTALIPSSGNPNSPFAKQEIREAVEYAIDKQKICDTVFYGFYQPQYQFATPALRPARSGFVPRTYDATKARELIKAAGYTNGFSTTLYCAEVFNGDDIPLIQSYLNAVGIQTTVQIVTIAKWIDMETNGWDDGLLISPTGNDASLAKYYYRFWWTPDAPNWSRGLYWTALNRPPELQAMLDKFMAEPDAQKQIEMGKDIAAYQAEICIAIPLWDWTSAQIMQPYVHDVRYDHSVQFTPYNWDWVNGWMEQDKIKK